MTDQSVPSYQVILERVQSAPLKIIFVVHFVLVSLVLTTSWIPDAFLFYNLLFFLTLFWSMHCKDNEEPILLCFAIDVFGIVFDIIIFCVYFRSMNAFSGIMALFNLLARPLSGFALHNQWKARAEVTTGNGFAGNNRQHRNYVDIESSGHQSVPGMSPPAYH